MKRKLKKGLLYMSIALFIFLLFTALIPFLRFTFTSSKLPEKPRKIVIIGHRGAAGLAPENTIASFKKAIELGVDMIELDVHVTKDDSVVVMHDYSVNRTTNGEGDIENLNAAYITGLDAGSKFDPAYNAEKVPSLKDVLLLANGRVKVLIELKWPAKGIYTNLVKRVLEVVKECKAEQWVILQTFEEKYLQEIHTTAPNIECQQLIFGKSVLLPVYFTRSIGLGGFKPEPYVSSLNLFYIYLSKSLVKEMHAKNATVYVFTLNKKDKIAKAINLGVDGIITDRPDIAIDLLKSK